MVEPYLNDETIPDDEDLYRRIAKDWLVKDEATGRLRLSSAAFRDNRKEISVHLSSLITASDSLSRGGDGIIGLVSITAGQARSLDQGVVRDPLPDDEAHALICGRQSKTTRRHLAATAVWVCPIDGPE